jgi:hypothetical protein
MQASDAYNVFQRKQKPALRCAVAQGRPVPAFVSGEAWSFSGTIRDIEEIPEGFRLQAARAAMRWTGYYLFHALSA